MDGKQKITRQSLVQKTRELGEGLRRSARGWDVDPAGMEAYLEWNRQQRKQGRREIEK